MSKIEQEYSKGNKNMKKQNNIGKYIAKAVYAMAFVVSLCACTDDYTTTNNYIEEGIPVEIGIKYATPEMTNISTRGLNPSDEEQVNDLYIFIFNESGNERKKGSRLYTSDEINEGKITISTTSGNSRIYAIANVQNNQQQNLQVRLDGIKSVTQLEAAYIETALINGVIDVDRTSPNLVMSGAFVANDATGKPTGYCPITIEPNQDFTEKGNIELVHFDSHIKFRIRTGDKVMKFEPKTWQVLNVPRQSYLIERTKENAGTEADHYEKSTVYNNQNFLAGKDDNGNNIHTFEFYQFENFKKSKNGLPEAKDREKEVKVDGKNTGEFYYVEPHATYVEFTASMELDENGVQRIADVRFTVLLGGKDSKTDSYRADNFNTWRNKKYTYDVTINGVDDITTEVSVGTETRPGIEGDVIDANGEVRILDAHYNCFNITLTKKQVEDMSILVHTPFDEIEYVANNETKNKRPDENRDYKWIKFKRAEGIITTFSQPLAKYGKAGEKVDDDAANGRLDIYSLKNDVIEWAKGKNENEPLYYTVFVDEYYYEEEPCDEVNWGDKNTYWTKFVNQEPRYVMLVYTPDRSVDGESSWSKAQYFIRQRSIQTYYSTTNLTEDETALGMEHVNESSTEKELEVFPLSPINTDNGFLNCSNFFIQANEGKSWEAYADYRVTTLTRSTNTVWMKSGRSHVQCLYRNRDKNGDGIINANEMEWYLPTFNQISGMYLGATSLPSPLFTPSGTTPVYNDPNYHFATSDADKLWAQEGCSNNGPGSTILEPNKPKLPANEVRCVRNLGVPAGESINRTPQKPYIRTGDGTNKHYVYDMSQMAPSNLRTSPSNTLNYHDNFTDTRNKPYRKFELAKDFTEYKAEKGGYSWALFNNGKDLCQDYFEGSADDAIRGKGKWRTPNQRELLIIYNTGSGTHDEMVQDNYGMYSCTYWTYGQYDDGGGSEGYRTFGFNASGGNMYLDNNNDKGNHANDHGSILRCVRDMIE